jgi:endonuclease/exonuclease/phosphatase family metal-dependent hydrolase
MKRILFLWFTFLFLAANAQDSLQIMQYNLLHYGNNFSDCNSSTNNVNEKNQYLQTIIDHVKPDIFTVNELADEITYHQMILNQVLNINGEDKYRKAVSFNFSQSEIVNQMYYNNEKLAMFQQDVVQSLYRDIDVYTLYYKAGDLSQTLDTIFLTCFVAHLKAGQTTSDEADRAEMTTAVMDYIRTNDLKENLLFMGDLNLYTSSEEAYQILTDTYNGIQYFFDPIDREGNWNNNASFQDIHTQSTHSLDTECFSHGGMDDRFDFILTSSAILDGSHGLEMKEGSYQALGNDGQHFNKSILSDPENNSAPSEVIEALFGMSDHLPVLAQLSVAGALGTKDLDHPMVAIRFSNPNNGSFQIQIVLEEAQELELSIYDLFGRLQFEQRLPKQSVNVEGQVNASHCNEGMYLLVLKDANGNKSSKKFFIKK